jgi:hypothetical protein
VGGGGGVARGMGIAWWPNHAHRKRTFQIMVLCAFLPKLCLIYYTLHNIDLIVRNFANSCKYCAYLLRYYIAISSISDNSTFANYGTNILCQDIPASLIQYKSYNLVSVVSCHSCTDLLCQEIPTPLVQYLIT